MNVPLFAYGTLCRPAWRRAIFAGDYPVQPATLAGWRRIALPTGYGSLRPDPYGVVGGLLIDLDAYGWRIANAWEVVPTYVPIEVEARSADGVVPARVYVVPRDIEGEEMPDDRLALRSDEDVEADIRRFRTRNLWVRGRWELLLYRENAYVGGGRYESEAAAAEHGSASTAGADGHIVPNPPPDRYVVRYDPDPSSPATG